MYAIFMNHAFAGYAEEHHIQHLLTGNEQPTTIPTILRVGNLGYFRISPRAQRGIIEFQIQPVFEEQSHV